MHKNRGAAVQVIAPAPKKPVKKLEREIIQKKAKRIVNLDVNLKS
jgi:hypothetical protein